MPQIDFDLSQRAALALQRSGIQTHPYAMRITFVHILEEAGTWDGLPGHWQTFLQQLEASPMPHDVAVLTAKEDAAEKSLRVKFNENHGPDGRFATGDGSEEGGGGGGAGGGLAFPPQAHLDQAKLNAFGNSLNPTYQTTIDGNAYFVKTSNPNEGFDQVTNENLASEIGSAGGVGDVMVPVQVMSVGGEQAIVQPWTSGQTLAELGQAESERIAGSLSDTAFSQLEATQFILSDGDRHAGNYLYDAQGQSLKLIDYGLAFSDNRATYDIQNPNSSRLAEFRAAAQGVKRGDLTFDPAGFTSIVAGRDAILAAAKGTLDTSEYKGLARRLNALVEASHQGSMTLSQFKDLTIQMRLSQV
jgi:hypothetical protein